MKPQEAVRLIYEYVEPHLRQEKLAFTMEEFYRSGYEDGYNKAKEEFNEIITEILEKDY